MCATSNFSIRHYAVTPVSTSNAGTRTSGGGYVARDAWWGNVYHPCRLVDREG
jgi:hypothetical protein